MRQFRSSTIFAALAASALAAPAAAYEVQEIGSFHIGGVPTTLSNLPVREIAAPGGQKIKLDPNGDFHTGQMYVQYVKLANPQAKYPLLMWHTGGVTGATWETKPDGRPGWMQNFLKNGHSVYVSDAVERGRASFSQPEIYKSEPVFRDKRDGWEIFRIGIPGSYRSAVAERKANPGVKFPIEAFDTLHMQMVARWPNTSEAIQAAYVALVDKVCPCVIMAHGQAGLFAFRSAMARPEKVKGLIAIEPAFAPSVADSRIATQKSVPHLFVWGDFIGTNPVWVEHVQGVKPYHQAIVAQGGTSTWLDLPAEGITGNTHMPMMDTNSDQIAGLVQAWMAKNGLTKGTDKVAEKGVQRARPVAKLPARKVGVPKAASTPNRPATVYSGGNG